MNKTYALSAISAIFLLLLASGLVGFFYGTGAAILTIWILALNLSAGIAGFFWRGVVESRKRARRYRTPQINKPLQFAKRGDFSSRR